jgi:ssDNA-binding Zn-finger/Zn-ribbon topoisomerase 1
MSKHRCPKCGTAMDSYVIDGGRKLHVCGNNPDCDGYEVEEGEFKSRVMMVQPFHVINVMVKCS